MKSRTWMWMTPVYLFAVLAMPIWTAAQDNPSPDNKPKHKQYKLIDVGTFGGPASYASADNFGGRTLNNGGIAAGYADTSIPDPNSPNCFNTDCFVSHTFRWKNGVLTDLGALPGLNSTFATEINERGWIVGGSEDGVPGEIRAVLWKSDHIINLGTLGGPISFAVGINNPGLVVGHSSNTIPDPFSLDGFPTQTRGFVWENGP